MRYRLHFDPPKTARVLVWAALSGLLLWWLRWGSELVEITSYYRIRRSVPYIWNSFHEELPDVGNAQALDAIYWVALAVMVAGILALFWLALAPDDARVETASDGTSLDEPDVIAPVATVE
jgi:hypothetical protein